MEQKNDVKDCCGSVESGCGCGNGIQRRDFLKTMGLTAVGMAAMDLPVMAGPFEGTDFATLIPSDKKLKPEWVKSLYARGEPDLVTGDALMKIGMPIGGIACGQMYIAGDGRLWYWDIFNPMSLNARTECGGKVTDGRIYAHPYSPDNKVAHAFVVRIKDKNGKVLIKSLRKEDFINVTFRGEYPVAKINYSDSNVPVEVMLSAYSPFIPLNLDDSAIPATILSFTLKNSAKTAVDVDLAGWMDNAIPPLKNQDKGRMQPSEVQARVLESRVNSIESGKHSKALVFRPGPAAADAPIGAMALAVLGSGDVRTCTDIGPAATPEKIFEALDKGESSTATRNGGSSLTGGLAKSVTLKPGEEKQINFILAWHFPVYLKPTREFEKIVGIKNLKRRYARRFKDVSAVVDYVAANFEKLSGDTLRWNSTWYDSTLPYWFLDRTFLTIDCLATQTLHAFDNGRFWAWEGVDCCGGTCQHVWNYAQGSGRIFPEFERDMRERVDFGIAWHENGAMDYRAENSRTIAHDGHLGVILRAYREHQTSKDSQYLKRIWPNLKKSIEFSISWDKNADGLLEGQQANTCDAAWFGPMGWISSMFVAALRAGAAMAIEMDEMEFAHRCSKLADRGSQELVKQLYNGEYFIHKPDPEHPVTNTNDGCHIDQCMGQALALQLNLPRVTAVPETRKALASLWKYNFAPDAGGYRNKMQPVINGGRWYAMVGEAGLVMTSFPKGGADRTRGKEGKFAYYFNECWTGQEHQVAAHMIWDGLLEEGLAVTRAIHDRHNATLRNPYNEVECSDHYARAMSSYGSFLAVCGFEYHGPKGHIGFVPRMTPEDFKAPFTTAAGWGTFSQKVEGGILKAKIAVKWGEVELKTIALQKSRTAVKVVVESGKGSRSVDATVSESKGKTLVTLAGKVSIAAGETLMLTLG
jgi:uncharacterized protein (DUF608 family)